MATTPLTLPAPTHLGPPKPLWSTPTPACLLEFSPHLPLNTTLQSHLPQGCLVTQPRSSIHDVMEVSDTPGAVLQEALNQTPGQVSRPHRPTALSFSSSYAGTSDTQDTLTVLTDF